MYFLDSVLSAVSLAMDAFAVSLCIGAGSRDVDRATGVRMGLACGVMQSLMPLAGWMMGGYATGYLAAVDHWIAFALLAFVGGNMIRGSLGSADTHTYETDPTKTWTLLYIAVATSIDALAVGASFALTERPVTVLVIAAGLIAAILCYLGVRAGSYVGCKMGKRVELVGGLILILIGLNILREHILI